jgi:hypothetical protein
MNTNGPIVDAGPTARPGTGQATQATPTEVNDNHPFRWVTRGMMVGAALGLTAGSILPFLGTAIGGGLGLGAGFGIGVAMAVFALVTRKLFPTSSRMIEIRERVACVAVIWAPVLLPHLRVLAIPAALGSIHALAAGTPTRFQTYTGDVPLLRRRICNWLPWVILAIISVGWIIALTVVAMRER